METFGNGIKWRDAHLIESNKREKGNRDQLKVSVLKKYPSYRGVC